MPEQHLNNAEHSDSLRPPIKEPPLLASLQTKSRPSLEPCRDNLIHWCKCGQSAMLESERSALNRQRRDLISAS